MGDLISRKEVLDYIDSMPSEVTRDGHYMIRRIRLTEYISDTLPSAGLERKKGKWIWDDEMGVFLCSSCKNGWKDQPTLMGKPLFEWCPVCGAEMRGKEDEAN